MASESDGVLSNEMLQGELCSLPRLKARHEFTNGLVVRLHEFHGKITRDLALQLKQLAPLELLPEVEKCKEDSIRKKAESVWKEYKRIKQNEKKNLEQKLSDFLKREFQLPRSRTESSVPAQSTSLTAVCSKLKQAQKDVKFFKRKCAQAEHENEQLEDRYEWLIKEYYTTTSQMQQNADRLQKTIDEKGEQTAEVRASLCQATKINGELTAKLDSLQARIAKTSSSNLRNANKRLKRREETLKKKDEKIKEQEETIMEQEETIMELEDAAREAEDLLGATAIAQEQEQVNKRVESQLAKLQKKQVKSLQDSRRKLELKLEKMSAEKERVQVDLEAAIEHLTEKLKDLKTENTELQQIQALMETKTVTSFQDGKYSDEIREVVMTLLMSGVSMSKVDGVIRTVLERLANMTVDRLPSPGLKSRLLMEADILAKIQVAEALLSGEEQNKGNCLHQDGTSKFFKKYQTFDATLPSGITLTMGMSEIPSGDAAGITASFKESCRELAEVLCEPGQDVQLKTAQMITSFTSTMSDRGATNPLFNSQLEDLRKELLPVVKDNWDTLTTEVKDGLMKMSNYFCKMHLLVNFATEANSALKLFEDAVSEGKNPLAFAQQGESGAGRLVRTACSAFTNHGNEKSGTPHYFKSHLSHHLGEDNNYMVTHRGNRFNILFYNAAAVYYHHKHIRSFLSSWPDPNGLLKAVKADAGQRVYIAGVRALGIIDKTITAPFFRLLGLEKSVLNMNVHLHQMQLGLERWSKDASSLLAGEALFSEEVVARHKDAMFTSLFESEDDELDILTQQALEVVCASMLILLERQAEEQLPGGRFWEPSEAERQKSQHVPTTNVVSERDFAMLDNLIRAKPYATSLALEAYIMWLNNKTSTWLQNLSAEEKERHMSYARTHASSVYERFKEKRKQIKDQRLQALLKKQREKEEKLKRARERKVALTDKLMQLGGVWKSPGEVEEKTEAMRGEQEKLNALKCQLQFHKTVLGSQGEKEHFQMTVTRPGKKKHTFSSAEKVDHLKEVLRNNVTTTSFESGSESDEAEEDYVTLKDPDLRSVDEVRAKYESKLQSEREKREIKKYVDDPNKLVGCKVKHKFQIKTPEGNKEDKWYAGTVTRIVERTKNTKDTKFYIVYDDEDEDDETYNLLKDLEKGELVIL